MEAVQKIGNPSMVLLIGWLLFLLISLYSYFRKPKLAVYFLCAAAICIAAAFALFAPYLFAWDEQFHALVGKQLSEHPLVPKLYDHHPIKVLDPNWLSAEVWMHKQPLFTCQIALSVKLFGTNAFAVRLPSVLFHGALVAAVSRIGQLAFNRKTGFLGALLVMHSSFLLGLISGRIGTDHNDYIFLCYITFSCWAWFEWNHAAARKWLVWIGVFAGCAILTKWLVGLLVFAGWSAVVLARLKRGNFWRSIQPLLTSLAVTVLVAAPWQIYTLLRFPVEAGQEMAYNSAHVFHAVEAHLGDAWYHFDQLRLLYFNPTDFLLLFVAGLVFLIVRKVEKAHRLFILVSIGIVYLFFTIVQTKMPGFTAPVYGLVALVIAFGITELAGLIPYRKAGKVVLVALSLIAVNWILKPSPTLSEYGFGNNEIANQERKRMLKAYAFMRSYPKGTGKRVVFGVDLFPFSHISWMFFQGDDIAYPFVPSEEEIRALEKQGYFVLIMGDE